MRSPAFGQVRSSLRKLVRQHFKQSFEQSAGDEEAMLQSMPRSLRREVMIDINMRTIRQTPMFLRADKAMITRVCSLLTRAVFLRVRA